MNLMNTDALEGSTMVETEKLKGINPSVNTSTIFHAPNQLLPTIFRHDFPTHHYPPYNNIF